MLTVENVSVDYVDAWNTPCHRSRAAFFQLHVWLTNGQNFHVMTNWPLTPERLGFFLENFAQKTN